MASVDDTRDEAFNLACCRVCQLCLHAAGYVWQACIAVLAENDVKCLAHMGKVSHKALKFAEGVSAGKQASEFACALALAHWYAVCRVISRRPSRNTRKAPQQSRRRKALVIAYLCSRCRMLAFVFAGDEEEDACSRMERAFMKALKTGKVKASVCVRRAGR